MNANIDYCGNLKNDKFASNSRSPSLLGVYSESVYVVDLSLNQVFVCDFDGRHITHFGAKGRRGK